MRLYSFPTSSASYRVRIALHLKGTPFETVTVNLVGGEHRQPAYREINPHGRVPALELDDGTVIGQSLAIIDYLEQVHPEPPLYPADPVTRARALRVALTVTADIHCVTKWSKLDTHWEGVSVDTLLTQVEYDASYVIAFCDGGYTTNLPLEDVLDGKAWVVYAYDGQPLAPEHGGPARLLVPHLYFWKSAKWVRGLRLVDEDEPGFWESLGYHNHGDPWKEERYQGD